MFDILLSPCKAPQRLLSELLCMHHTWILQIWIVTKLLDVSSSYFVRMLVHVLWYNLLTCQGQGQIWGFKAMLCFALPCSNWSWLRFISTRYIFSYIFFMQCLWLISVPCSFKIKVFFLLHGTLPICHIIFHTKVSILNTLKYSTAGTV